jgi:hypothetical protein
MTWAAQSSFELTCHLSCCTRLLQKDLNTAFTAQRITGLRLAKPERRNPGTTRATTTAFGSLKTAFRILKTAFGGPKIPAKPKQRNPGLWPAFPEQRIAGLWPAYTVRCIPGLWPAFTEQRNLCCGCQPTVLLLIWLLLLRLLFRTINSVGPKHCLVEVQDCFARTSTRHSPSNASQAFGLHTPSDAIQFPEQCNLPPTACIPRATQSRPLARIQ